MLSISINEANGHLANLINKSAVSHQPITIKGDEHNAVLLSEQDWQAVQKTLYLLSSVECGNQQEQGI